MSNDEFKETIGKKVSPKVIIDSITFDGPVHLPDETLNQLVTSLKRKQIDGDPKWLENVEGGSVRSAWQDQGYFKAQVTGRALPLGGDATYQHFSVVIHVDEGFQYRLGSIRFFAVSDSDFDTRESTTGVTLRKRKGSKWDDLGSGDPTDRPIFSPEELRRLIPLEDGDILDAQKVIEGLGAIQKLYGTQGYIDATAEPMFAIDDEHQLISLRIAIDELQQYRIHQIDVFGLDDHSEKALTWKLKPGDIFDSQLFETFFKDNLSVLPAGASASNNAEIRRNQNDSTVDIKLDFSSCPRQ